MAENNSVSAAKKALRLKDPEKVKAALRGMGTDFSDEALSVYLDAFEHSFWMVREMASVLMGSAGSSSIAFIQKSYDKLSADQSYWCIQLLERLDIDGLPLLLKFCAAPDKDVRREAIGKLEKFDDPSILPSLVKCLDDPVWLNRKCASLVLESKAGTLPVLETIQSALQQGSENLTFWVLRIMSRLVGADPNNPVHAFLKHPNLRIKCAAIQAMGHMVDSQSIPILIGHLNDPSWIVRKSAASALMERGAEAEGFLKSAFKEGSHDMKYWAIKIMANITGSSRINTYQGFIQGQVEELKFYGIQALAEIREKESIVILIDCFRDRSWSVRKFASEQIASMGNAAISVLLDRVSSPEDDVKYWCIRTLADMGFVASSALKNLVTAADKDTRHYALGALEPPLSADLSGALVRCLDDKEASIQKMAADLLIRQGISSSRYLVSQLFSSNVNTSYWAKKVIVSLCNQNLDDLIDWLEEDESIRNKAVNYFSSVTATELPRILNGPMDDLKELINLASGDESVDDPFKMSGIFNAEMTGLFNPKTGSFGTSEAALPTAEFDVAKTGTFHADASKPMTGSELDYFLRLLHSQEGSDLHMSPGSKPVIRIHGELIILEEHDVLTKAATERMLTQMLSEDQRRKLERDLAIDCSYEIEDVARYRVNLFNQRRGLNGVYRIIPTIIPSFEELKMAPETFTKFCNLKQGLVLITGPTGSGKSSTLASLIDYINTNRREHIITVEDPIEFVHNHKKCLVSQREVGHHCRSFADALRSALREDPDIILVGEMRDLETISLAITASETGHLVFATLHTTNAGQTIDRMIDAYPPHQQPQVRVQLSNSIQAIIAQRLLPLARGGGRVPAHEILIRTSAVSNLIREGKSEQIFSQIQTGKEVGMQTMDDSLAKLIRRGLVRFEDAVEFAYDRKTFLELKNDLGSSMFDSTMGGGGGGAGRKPKR
jgi:twitching motility protein PilT